MRAAFTFHLLSPTPPAVAWSLVGDLAAVTEWVPGVTACTVDGDVRNCTFADGRTVVERIIDFDDTARSYGYSADTAGTPMTANSGSLAVAEASDGGSRVTWLAEVELVSDEAAEQMVPVLRSGYSAAFDQLAERLRR